MEKHCRDCKNFERRNDKFYPYKKGGYCTVYDAFYLENHITCENFVQKTEIEGEEKKSIFERITKKITSQPSQ